MRIDKEPKCYHFEEYKKFKKESGNEPSKPGQKGNKISWKEVKRISESLKKEDFIEVEEYDKNPLNNNNNQSPPPEFKPQIDSSRIDNAKDIQEARAKASEQINKMLLENKVKVSQLDKSL